MAPLFAGLSGRIVAIYDFGVVVARAASFKASQRSSFRCVCEMWQVGLQLRRARRTKRQIRIGFVTDTTASQGIAFVSRTIGRSTGGSDRRCSGASRNGRGGSSLREAGALCRKQRVDRSIGGPPDKREPGARCCAGALPRGEQAGNYRNNA
jgi:hypothetical protein